MSNFLKLTGVDFSNNTLPKLESFSSKILSLPGIMSWVSADDYYINSSDGLVSRLIDRTGNGNDFIQSDLDSQPRLTKDTLNNKSALSFDAANTEFMIFDGEFPSLAAESYVKLMLVNIPDVAYTANLLSSVTDPDSRHTLYMRDNSTAVVMESANSGALISTSFVGGWHLLIAEFNADTSEHVLFVDNTVAASSSVTPEPRSSDLYLGAGSAQGAAPGTFDVAEVMIFSDSLVSNSENLSMIQRYFSAKYNLGL